MPSLDELMTPITKAEAEASLYDVCDSVGINHTLWKPGAWPRTVITGCAILFAAFSELNANVAKQGFLATASGTWLELKALYDYNVVKEQASFATGKVTLVNSSGGIYNLDPDDIVISNPTTKKTYRNTETVAIGALATVTDVPIKAVEAGSASNSAPNTITQLETTLNGVSVTNPLSVVGNDAETDPQLRSKCSEKLGSLSPMGPWDAYTFAAKNARRNTDGTSVGVTRVKTSKDGFGNVTVYVATASGEVTGDVDDIDTDLGAVDEAIQQFAAPFPVNAITESAEAVAVPVTYQLWMYNSAGLTNAQVVTAVEAALIAFFSSEPIGGNFIDVTGKLYQSAIAAAIGATRYPADSLTSLPIFRVVVTLPASDVSLNENQVPVIGTIIPTITQISPSTPGG